MRAPEPPYPSFSLALQKIVEPHENWSIASSSAEDHRQRLFRKDHDDHLMRTVYYTYQDDLEQPPIYHGYHFNVLSHMQVSTDSTTSERRGKLSLVFMRLIDVLIISWDRIWTRHGRRATTSTTTC